jgi:hypothetical protein
VEFLSKFIEFAEESKYDLVFDEICTQTWTFTSAFTHRSKKTIDIKYFAVDLSHPIRTSKKNN